MKNEEKIEASCTVAWKHALQLSMCSWYGIASDAVPAGEPPLSYAGWRSASAGQEEPSANKQCEHTYVIHSLPPCSKPTVLTVAKRMERGLERSDVGAQSKENKDTCEQRRSKEGKGAALTALR